MILLQLAHGNLARTYSWHMSKSVKINNFETIIIDTPQKFLEKQEKCDTD